MRITRVDSPDAMALTFAPFRLDPDGNLWRGRTRIPLPPKETALLRLLAEAKGRVISKTEILDQLWPGEDVGEASITRCIRGVRRALREGGRRGGTIETMYGRGYRLALPVRSLESTCEAATAGALRVGVIPFDNASRRREDAYLASGIAGEITDSLAKARAEGITVIARQSTARLRGRTPDLFHQARALRLDYAVTGRLHFAAGALHVEVELVRVSDEALLWSEQFRTRSSLLSQVASEIATAVAAELGRISALRSMSRPPRAPVVASRSYLALLQGQFSSQLRTERGVRRAIELFEQAIAWDPEHCAAHAALADALLMLGFWGYEAPLAVAERVRSTLRRAFALDRRQAQAHASLAYLRYAIDYDPDAALRAVDRALALEPNHARSHWIRGAILKSQGRFEVALEAYEAARDTDPFSPLLALDIAFVPFCAQRLEPALAAIRALTASEPEFAIGHAIRATIAAAAGRSEEATRSAEIAEGLARGNAVVLGSCTWALAKAGQTAHANALRTALEKKAARRYVAPSYLALAALALGDTEAALAALERGLEQRSMYLPFVGVDPRFAALRGDARFERIAAIARGASRAEPATPAQLLRAARA